ncbi:MAG: hypothetical protein HZC24_02305 [Rhodocyclales bacterium]|nr:hypothetical protein [Rhodocyclales bacterium]
MALRRAIEDDHPPLDDWITTLPIEDMRARLLNLRGFGWLDGSLHGDAGVARSC